MDPILQELAGLEDGGTLELPLDSVMCSLARVDRLLRGGANHEEL